MAFVVPLGYVAVTLGGAVVGALTGATSAAIILIKKSKSD